MIHFIGKVCYWVLYLLSYSFQLGYSLVFLFLVLCFDIFLIQSVVYTFIDLYFSIFMPLLSFVKRFTVLILHSKSWILSNLLSQGIIAMELIIFEKIYCLDFSCCMYFYDGTWASGVGSSIAHFGIDPCHYFVELVFGSPFASNWAWQVLV